MESLLAETPGVHHQAEGENPLEQQFVRAQQYLRIVC